MTPCMPVFVRMTASLILAAAVTGSFPLTRDDGSTVTYRLAPAPLSADTLAELPQPLSLDRVTVAALDTDRIRVTRGHQRLDHYAHARWAAPLPDVLSDALARLL